MGAKVFISCGQVEDEKKYAENAKQALIDIGFNSDDIYIATAKRSLRAIVDNIYRELKSAEYFLFIDFDRGANGSFSVFSHQELAVASFLEIPVLAFQKKGSAERSGILKYVMANPIPFVDYEDLKKQIKLAAVAEKWNPHYQRNLSVTYDDADTTLATDVRSGLSMRFHHAKVENMHDKIIARETTVYLESYTNLSSSGSKTTIDKISELKWAGTALASIPIMPGYPRLFDCVITIDAMPGYAHIPCQTDASDYRIQLPTGSFELQYVVICDVFPPTRLKLRIDVPPATKGTAATVVQI